MLALRCGLLAKWLKVMVRVRAWARECTSCVFFPSGLISVSIFVFGGSVGARGYEYSIDDVTATWIEVYLVSLNLACLSAGPPRGLWGPRASTKSGAHTV